MIKDIIKSVFPTLMLPIDSENELLGEDDISKTVLSVIKWHIVETWEDLPDDDKRSTLLMYKDKMIEVADPEDRYIGKWYCKSQFEEYGSKEWGNLIAWAELPVEYWR